MNCDTNATSFLLVSMMRHWKKADFSWQQNLLLIIRSQHQYQVVGKIFQPSKVSAKIYILSCTHILLKINVSHIQTTCLPVHQGEHAHSLGTSGIDSFRIPSNDCKNDTDPQCCFWGAVIIVGQIWITCVLLLWI
jgi:hypothetical protein